jgi:hypothetical protein
MYAQGVTNSGNFRVHSGGSLSTSLNFTNSSTAVLVNNGTVYLGGNITNDEASMSAGSGSLHINGSSSQTLNGSAELRTYDLVTDNSNGITLNNNLSIAGTHTFTNGLIHTSSTPNYLIYESGATHSGSGDSRHVTGWVKKNGNNDFTFPVGDNSYLRSIALSGLTAISEFNCHYYTPSSNIYSLFSPLVKVKGNEYWQIDKVSGGSANVTLNWDHTKVPMDNILLSDIRAGHYTGTYWTNAGGAATGDVTTTGSVTSNAISSFSPFTLGYVSFPIPLKLLSFTGWRRTGITYLHWVTENEQSVDHFAVQRSFDGISFAVIGNVNARNSGIRELYSFDDRVSFTGTAYYRLCSIDIDGKYSYSKVVAVSESGFDGPAFVVLNPVQTAIAIINRSVPGGMYAYNLYSSSGQLVLKGNISLASNAAGMIRLPIHLSYGIYTLELANEKIRFRQQLLIEK